MSDFVNTQTVKEHLSHLPGDILLSIATNDATPVRNKRAAVELLLEHECPQAASPFISHIVGEIKADAAAKTEVADVVEQAAEEPLSKPNPVKPKPGPQKASVTTDTL